MTPTASRHQISKRWLFSIVAIVLSLGSLFALFWLLGHTSVQAAGPVDSPPQLDADAASALAPESILTGDADRILEGNQTDVRLGIHGLDTAGDVNGDGYVDIIVGSDLYDVPGNLYVEEGVAFIFHGSASGVEAMPAVTLTVGQDYADFGRSVAGAGDINGDGYADVVVGAPVYDAPANNEGAVFVYYGSASGISATPAITLQGALPNISLGRSVAGAGDVNGDGYADIIVAADGYDNGEENEGAAFVYHGSATGLVATPAITLENNITETQLRAVDGAGDVNGDGYADVVIGSGLYDTNNGIVYVHHGSSAGVLSTPAITLQSVIAGGRFGISLAGAGDVNGDGYADVVIGADQYANSEDLEGAIFVYHGSATGISATPAITVETNMAGSWLGNSVAGAGDVNGDGYADVIAGARVYDLPYTDAGVAFVYRGSAGGIDPTTATALSGVSGIQYGYRVAGAGDVNGDGYADVMVAQDYYSNGQSREGAVYIYHGGGDTLQSAAAWTATGEAASDSFGAVAAAGDVNGDGFSDVLVGASGYMANTGRAYLYLGGIEGLSTTAALTLTGDVEGDQFGPVAAAGDVNGDGYADVVVGARGYLTHTGRAYLYLGSAAGLNPTPALTLTGENEGDYFGRAATAGDVNGDGYADVVIAAHYYPGGGQQGKIYLYHGSAAGLSATPALTITGEGTDRFGVSVGTAGDVNGDGYADVVVGAEMYPNGAGHGRVYVYHGSSTGLSATPAFIVTGASHDNRFGTTVSTAGDVNGDGYSDIVVGADYYTIGWQEGRAYVYLGGSGGLDTTPVFVATGEYGIDHFGRAVGTAGDVNGDGYADVVIGAPDYPANNRVGRVYVYFGGEGGPDTTPDFIVDGQVSGNRFGSPAGTAGDVDGDGFSDLLVGAPPYSSSRGKAYLYTNGDGRQVLHRQLRGDGSDVPVQPWGLSYDPDGFLVRMNATDPMGRGVVKLQVEACPAGVSLGDASCVDHVTPSWTDVTINPSGIVFTETLSGLSGDTVYRWRARVLYDSLFYPYGPWRRLFGQGMEADLRVGTPPDVAVHKTVTPGIAGPGQTVTYTLAFTNPGSLAAAGVIIVDQIPAPLTDLAYWSSRPVTPTGAFSYTWQVGDLGAGEGGVITVSGTVDPSASGLFDLVNRAVISTTAADGDLGNNTSIVTSTVDAESPIPPVLFSPPDGKVISDTTPALTWQASPSPDVAGYWLDFDGTVIDMGDVTDYAPTMLADGVYTWTVAAYDGAGNTSSYADVWSFEVDTTPPDGVDDGGAAYTTDEDTTLIATGNVLSNDSDPGGGPVTLTGFDDSTLTGLLTDNGDGTFGYDPNGQFEYLGASEQAEDVFSYTIADRVGLTDTAIVTITVTGVNDAPIADAGADQFVDAGEVVTLDGTASFDPEGEPLIYDWAQTGGEPVALSDSTSAMPTFTSSITHTVLTFRLVVTDAQRLPSAADEVVITVGEERIYLPLVIRGV